jgi:hypothetical protein
MGPSPVRQNSSISSIFTTRATTRFIYLSAERSLRLAVLSQDSPYGQAIYDGVNKTIAHYNLSMVVVAAENFNVG